MYVYILIIPITLYDHSFYFFHFIVKYSYILLLHLCSRLRNMSIMNTTTSFCRPKHYKKHKFPDSMSLLLLDETNSTVPARQPKLILRPLTVSWANQCPCPRMSRGALLLKVGSSGILR